MNKTPKSKAEPLPNSLRDWINQSDEKRAEVKALIAWGESLKSVIRDARLQLNDRSVLGLPKTDEQRERDKDLEYESRVDYESWQYDGPETEETNERTKD